MNRDSQVLLGVQNTLVFMYPSKNIGGAQIHFARIAQEVAERSDFKVAIVDYADGFMRNLLKFSSNIDFIDYMRGVQLPNNSITIVPFPHLVDLRFLVEPKCLNGSFLLYSLHTEDLNSLHRRGRSFFRLGDKKLRRIIGGMADNATIIFMNKTTKHSFEEKLNIKIETDNFVPVPVGKKLVSEFDLKKNSEKTISLAWLGRLHNDKIHSIMKIIEDIAASSHHNEIIFHIIGDGVESSRLVTFAEEKKVSVKLVGVLTGLELDTYLKKNIDVGISMGGSCLEIAHLKIPSAVVDYSGSKIPRTHKYSWLYEEKNFDLGADIKLGNPRTKTLENLISEVSEDQDNLIGEKCYTHVLTRHSTESCADALLAIINKKIADKSEFDIFKAERLINTKLYSFIYRGALALRKYLIIVRYFYKY